MAQWSGASAATDPKGPVVRCANYNKDAVFMLTLRNSAKNKYDPDQFEAKTILKKIETESKLTAKDDKWIASFKCKHDRRPAALDFDNDEYQFDEDLVSPEKAIETYSKDMKEPDDQQYQQIRDKFFTRDKVEDVRAESMRKAEQLRQELTTLTATATSDEYSHLVNQLRKEEETQKKNTSVHVWSIQFGRIHESTELQDLVVRCERILLRHFYHAHFLPGQLQSIVCALTKACDCVASMRTGGGKTMIFAIPALLEDQKTTIVFTPMRSLIIDQMNEMKKLGIESGYLMSEIEMKKIGEYSKVSVLRRLTEGKLKVLFTTPEQAFSNSCMPTMKEMIAKKMISRIVVDEAHLLRQWENFRTQFQNFGTLRSCFPGVPMILMTACLPRATRSHLSSQIGFKNVMIVRSDANRRNAFYMVQRKICDIFEGVSTLKDEYKKIRGPTLDRMVELLRGPFRGASAIIYCRTARLTEILSKYLREHICDTAARHFHAQLSQEERVDNQRHWTESTVPIMVATCAFGLGINHPHVRLIVHWDMPQTLDDYFQQAGRAGRDGAPCLILSFYHPHDLDGTLSLGVSDPHRSVEVACYMENQIFCRRALILSEYAEPIPPQKCQTSCDVCYYKKTWGLYDISRFANNLLALVVYLPHHLEPLDVKQHPFRWLVSLLRCDMKAIKSILSNSNAAILCRTGIVPGCGSMKNICKDDAFTIVLSLFEHGVFKVIRQDPKQYGRGQQSHSWKILPGDNLFCQEMSSCISERYSRLVKPRFIGPMLIPLPAVTIQRLHNPVLGTWDQNPDHAMFCGWCKYRCFALSDDSFEVRPFVCAPILAHKECIEREHDDEENRKEYDDPENCLLCRNEEVFIDGQKKKGGHDDRKVLVICSSCNRGTCFSCLNTLYDLDDETIKILTGVESAKFYCANCDPFTVPVCYQWYRADKILEFRGQKDVVFRKRDEPTDLLSALLQQKHSQCERALQFCEQSIEFMENDLMPLDTTIDGKFPLFSFVTLNDFDSVQHYYMVMSHSSAGSFVYAVEFLVNSRSNALQPPKPLVHELFDEKFLLRMECHKIKQIDVDTKQFFHLDGTSNIWCPLNTVNKIRRELLAKIRSKQRYRWKPLELLDTFNSEIKSDPQGVSEKSSFPQISSSPTVQKRLMKNDADSINQRETSTRSINSKKDLCEPKDSPSLLMKRSTSSEESPACKSQKVVDPPSLTSMKVSTRSKFEDILHRISNDSNFYFDRKDWKCSFDFLMTSFISQNDGVLTIDATAIRISQTCLAGSEYGEFSIHHAIFIAMYQAALPVRSSDIALIFQSMGFCMLYRNSASLAVVIQNILHNHYRDFPGGIFQCKNLYWFLNPKTFNPKSALRDFFHVKDSGCTNLSKADCDSICTPAATFGRCLKICPNTFLKVEAYDEDRRYCMVTTEKDTGKWYKVVNDDEETDTQVLVRWFVLRKDATGKLYFSHGAKELLAHEGGTDRAWEWVSTTAILEVIFVRWGLLEPHEKNWFEFFYTKNINTFEVSSGPGKKSKTEKCISDCNPIRFQEDFWDHDLLEFQNPDPYQSKLHLDLKSSEDLFEKAILSRNSMVPTQKSMHSTFELLQDRTHLNLICAHNLMSRHYPHSSTTKMNVRSCHVFEFADLIEAVIFTLLQSQVPMNFQTLCDKIGVPSKFRDDLSGYCKNALSPGIFLMDNFADLHGHRSKCEYISLKMWEDAFESFRKIDVEASFADHVNFGREGNTWKRAFVSVSNLHPKASILYKCAVIANAYPGLCERHLKSEISKSSAAAAYFLHEIAVHLDVETISTQVVAASMDPDVLKIMKSAVLFREIMESSARPSHNCRQRIRRQATASINPKASSAPETSDYIMITSDEEPPVHVIDAEIDDDDSDDDEQFSMLHRKRPLEPLKSEDIEAFTRDADNYLKLRPDDQIIFQFAFLFCLKSLQSNLKFPLSSVRDRILYLYSNCGNVMVLVEFAVISLQNKTILVYNSSEKECDPSPCFHLNMEKGLVTSLANRITLNEVAKVSGNANGNADKLLKTKSEVNHRAEFSFVAPPECQSFKDEEIFLRYHAELNNISAAAVTKFTSMYSHFADFEAAISFLKTLDEDLSKHACSNSAHPIVQLIEGNFKDMVPQLKDDDDDLEFEEHLSIRHDDDANPEVFQPYCQRPDPNLADYRRKIETFLKLDFEVAYSIEHYISSGGLLWNALDHQDLEKMERYSDELVEARKSNGRDKYVLVLNKIKVQLCNKVNMERMKSQSALDHIDEMTLPANKKNNDRKKVASEDIQAMERCTVFAGVFHEHRGVKLKPSVYGKFSCRAYRKFGSHRFMTVSIPRSATPEKVRCLLNHGFKTIIGDRLYQFIPSGDSHLKERKLMFFAVSGQHLEPILPQSFLQWHIPMSRDPHSEYFSNSEIISIKFFARFQLCFSASAVAMTLSAEEYEYIDDIEVNIPETSKKACATDGCGLAPPAFFAKIQQAFKLAFVPSCVQIRFGGCKGLLHVDTRVSKIQFRRKSQRKYICDDAATEQRQIEVTSWSPSHQASTSDMSAKLNLQLAFVLRSMGVPDEFFYSLLKQTQELVLGAIGKGSSEKLHRDAALEFVQKFKGMPHCEEIRQILEQNILDVSHPYIVRALRHAIELLLNPIQTSFHMPVPEMKFLYGVPDPTGILEYGQCFVLLGEPADGAIHRRFEDTDVLVGRNPMQHPGDVRKLTAVFVPELYAMKLCNVIVFPVKGNPNTGQLLNDEMSGGDFDGDQYIFIWNKEITKSAMQHDPYAYYLDGKALIKTVPSVACSSICVGSSDSKDSAYVDPVELSTSERTIVEKSQQLVGDDHHHELSDVSNVAFDANAFVPAEHVEPQSSFCAFPDLTQGPSPTQNPIVLSDPAKWTSDDVKAHFNNKIGFCPEEAYEKLKLCALGVICHWENSLGRLCNLQRDIADFSLHEAKMSGSDNHRINGFADPNCMEIAPLVARAVDSLKTGEIVRVPKKFSKTAEHWLKSSSKSKHKEGSTYNSSSLFGVISKDIAELQHQVLFFVQSNSYEAVNSQLIESMCKTQHRAEVTQLVQKVRKRVDEEFHVIFENASHLDAGARSQHMTEGINRMCKEQEEFVRQHLTDKGYGANLIDYIKMFVGLLYQTCYADMRRLSDSSFGLRKKAKDSNEDPEIQAVENRAERDSSSKWTLVQLPFKIFHPVLQTQIKSFNDLKQHVVRQ